MWLRCRVQPDRTPPAPLVRMLESLAQHVAPVEEDRRLDLELQSLVALIRSQEWTLYA
jgi:hypothetical protein